MSGHRYANVANPHVNALVTGRFRFEHESQALKKMEYLGSQFTQARNRGEEMEDAPDDKHCMVLWIRDFAVTPEEEEEGYLGNYAFITPEELDNGLYTLSCVKLDTELKFHPRRKRKKARLPNWGHPILRSAQKQKRYPTIESIQAELDQMQLEYPDTTIPSANRLFLMIFDRKADPKNPAQKYILEILPHKEGGYYLSCHPNEHQGRAGPNAETQQENAGQAEEAPQGYFASMVTLKKRGKQQKAAAKEAAKQAEREALQSGQQQDAQDGTGTE